MDRRHFLGFVSSLALLPPALSFAAPGSSLRVSGYRLSQGGDATRLVLDLQGDVHYHVFALPSPSRIVVDLDGVAPYLPVQNLDLGNTPITAIRSGKRAQGLRLVLETSEPIQPLTSLVQGAGSGRQLVIELPHVGAASLARNEPPRHASGSTQPQGKAQGMKSRPLVIAIDAGHGGKDPGAISSSEHYEKYVAIGVASKLHDLLGRSVRFAPAMTRDDDHFIPLRERVLIAHRNKADMFISIHADAAPSTSATGASVYALSEHGATSAMASWMADSENSADQYASLRDSVLNNQDPELSKVLVDMSMSATINSSLDLGGSIISNLGQVTRLHQRQVDQAGFAVLKSPDIPSILVETGFMSNRDDCSRLITDRHQQELAEALHGSIEDYFKRNPLPYMIA